jgi:DNA-binding Lrp family transcriptional regulator
MALNGVTAEGDTREVAGVIADLDESIYVVAVSGSFDVLVDVVCRDSAEFLSVLNEKIRSLPAVTATSHSSISTSSSIPSRTACRSERVLELVLVG